MNVLIVGGAGYIGGALTDILRNTKHAIRVYDALVYEDDYLKNVPFVFGDVRNHQLLKKHLTWADAVVWLAALVGDGACALNPNTSRTINQDSVKWLSDNFDGRIIFTSTCSVYGRQDGMLNEESPTNPLSVYGQTKLAAEGYLRKKNAMIFRLGTLFGIGDHYSRIRLDLVVNTLTAKATMEHNLKIYGGQQFRPLLHVRDAAKALADNLETKHTGIYNLHGRNMKMHSLARTVARFVPDTSIETTDMKFEDLRNYHVSSRKAQKAFNFSPQHSIKDGIHEIKQLFTEKRIKNPESPRYTNAGQLTLLNNHITLDKPKIIAGGIAKDDRGHVSFVNDFNFNGVKRSYLISIHQKGIVRAWHGHKKEAKYAFVTSGTILIGLVAVDDWKRPSKRLTVKQYVLSADKPKVLYIPPGYANGFMSLTTDTKILFYSTETLEESEKDDVRFDSDCWDIWKVKQK